MNTQNPIKPSHPQGALTGVRVLDMTSVGMGPLATQMLGDMGADVVKIESPEGDSVRHTEPAKHAGMGTFYLNFNRNKRSMVLNLRDAADRAVFQTLLGKADVLVSNLRPQSMKKMGLDYPTLAAQFPRLIYAGAYGFGEGGPYAGRPAYDDVIQGMCGMADLQGMNRGAPAFVNTIIADKVVGLTLANALLAALFERERSGLGQAIEVPMFETMVAFLMTEHLCGATFYPSETDLGYPRILNPFRKPHPTKDGYLCVLPYTDKHWRAFFILMGKPEWQNDPRYGFAETRAKHLPELYQALSSIMPEKTSAEWMALLEAHDIPHAPINRLQDLFHDPHLTAIQFFGTIEHPEEGTLRTVANPINFSRTPTTIRKPPPSLDADRASVLAEWVGAES